MDTFQTLALRAPFPKDGSSGSGIGLRHHYVCVIAASRDFCTGLKWYGCSGLPPIVHVGKAASTREEAVEKLYRQLYRVWIKGPSVYEAELRSVLDKTSSSEEVSDYESQVEDSVTGSDVSVDVGMRSAHGTGQDEFGSDKSKDGIQTPPADFLVELDERLKFEKSEQLFRIRDMNWKMPSQEEVAKTRELRRRALLQLHFNSDETRPQTLEKRKEYYQSAVDLIERDPHISEISYFSSWMPKYPARYMEKRQRPPSDADSEPAS
jgi:hypothetical protein